MLIKKQSIAISGMRMEIRAATVALELLRKASLTETIIDSDSKFISESSIWMAMVRVAAAC